MKILHVISALGSGGAEVFVKDLCIALKQRGHDVAIAYVDSAKDRASDVGFEDRFKSELAESDIAFFEIGQACRRSPLKGGLRLRTILRQVKPDILHLHLGLGILFKSFAFCSVPTVYTHHSIMFRFGKLMTWWFDRFVKAYVAICDKCHVMLEQKTARPIVDIRNGISSRRIAKPDLKRGCGSFKIISVGSIREAKDYPTTIAIAARVKQLLPAQHRQLEFLIYGDGDDGGLGALRELARAKAVDDILHFKGQVTDIPERLAAADILLMSSIYEGMPISLIEATHAGLPMIATDVGGCAEIVRNGENGFIFTPKDVEAGAHHILKLFISPELCRSFSARSREIAQEFSMEKVCAKHLALYEQTLNGK
jgi:glycosyltransferase involved in cell wall biosynthesis